MRRLKYLYSVLFLGEWQIGFETRKTWRHKSYWSIGKMVYDVEYYYLHIGWFYICLTY